MNFIVLPDGGQSNDNSEVLLSTLTSSQLAQITPIRKNVYSFYGGVMQYFQTGYNNRRRSRFEQRMGWRDELARLINFGGHDPVIFLQHAEGGTGVAGRWNTSVTEWDDSELLMLLNKIDEFEYYFNNHPKFGGAGHTFTYGAFLWNQGEQDAGNIPDATAYQTNCQNTWDSIKTKLGNSNIPIFDWKLSDQILGAAGQRVTVNNAKIALQAANANVTLYNTDGVDGYSMIDQSPLFIHYDYNTCVNTVAPNLYADLISQSII